MPQRWVLPNVRPDQAASLAQTVGITLPAAQVLLHRGLDSPAAARTFLHPAPSDLNDPLAMRDMPRAADRLERAIHSGEKILIYGDYDVDGTSSVVILTKA